jgi:alpha-L-rhamnosidase
MRAIICLLAVLLSVSATAQKSTLTLASLATEYKTDPIGLETSHPRFSWKLNSPANDVKQLAYELMISSGKWSWTSGKRISDQSHLISYTGDALQPMTRYTWQVRVWDSKGIVSHWSAPAFFEMGMMGLTWNAKWIEPENRFSTGESLPPVMTRTEFSLGKKIKWARLYVTSRGLYRFYINGKPVGEDLFTPGWTSYNKRLQYQVYDVTSMLQNGKNAAGAILAEGWYRGTLGWGDNRNLYGKKLGLLCTIRVMYMDGSTAEINSDDNWKATDEGPVRFSGIYDGETYDAGMEQQGWSTTGFADAAWWNVAMAADQQQILVANEGEYVHRMEEIKPVKIFRTPKGELVADMGQNMVGWIRIRVKGKKGDVVRISHAEVLDKDGNFYTENLRAAKQQLIYKLKGEGIETYEPLFTFMGFRFIRIDEYPGEPGMDDLKGIVVHSDMKASGEMETGHNGLNQLQHNIIWGQKGNFLDVPTDCPQRDERLGWTGDAQAFIRTASFNFNVAPFFTKWLKDVAADQHPDGKIPFVIPNVLGGNSTSAGWGDVAVIAPMTIYDCYGDIQLLEAQYPSMKKYVEYIRNVSGDSMIWKNGSVFGDWLYYHPGEFDHTTSDGHTDRDLISTAFFGYSTQLVARAAGILGKKEEQTYYNELFNKIRTAFNREYVSTSGRVYSGSQTSYVLALMFDLLPEDKRGSAAAYLVKDIKNRDNHLSTGFLGTPYLCHVLSRFGYDSVAYDLLLQESYPSWLYPVRMGATTIWERWDGMKPDKSFQDKGMNSFNHYAYGAIGEWMYRRMAGIDNDPSFPGYKHFYLRPVPTARIDHSHAAYESPYGTIISDWKLEPDGYSYHFKIPANTSATLTLTHKDGAALLMNNKPMEASSFKRQGDKITMELGSGEYQFTTRR